ncbi:MAG: hypothetical protein LUI09_02090 [Prevotellaceae bacterium]|nr:hypothetical protein [Prevotellaceae bacterium]
MHLPFLEQPSEGRFDEIAQRLMNGYCALKRCSGSGAERLYRFAEIEFYLYDARQPRRDVIAYPRACPRVEWFFHYSGVDIAFATEQAGGELLRFGGILVRGVEAYERDAEGRWTLRAAIGGPRRSMYELFNHSEGMPDVVELPEGLRLRRPIVKTSRVGVRNDLPFRYVMEDVSWTEWAERAKGQLDARGRLGVRLARVKVSYSPKPARSYGRLP